MKIVFAGRIRSILMFNKFFDRLFNGSNERDIKKMRQLVEEKINPQESALKKLSDSSLANKTNEFKARLAKGETLDDILPDAFAVIREASRRPDMAKRCRNMRAVQMIAVPICSRNMTAMYPDMRNILPNMAGITKIMKCSDGKSHS